MLRSRSTTSIYSKYKWYRLYLYVYYNSLLITLVSIKYYFSYIAIILGYVLVWDNVSCKDKHASDDTNYKKKKHRKTLNLQKSSITVIIDNEGYVNLKPKITLVNLVVVVFLM